MSSAQIETLESLLSQGTLAVGDLKVALMRLSAEVTDRMAKGSSASYDFFVGVVEAVSKVKGVTHADIRLSCLFDSSVFFYRSGFARAALQTSDSVYKLARRIDSKPWMRKASTLAGIVHSEAGSVSEAVMHYCDALGIARELRDNESEVLVLINLGAAFNYASLYHEGIRCLSRAIDLCGTAPLGKYLAVAYCDLAQAYLSLEEFHLGFEAITRSLVAWPIESGSVTPWNKLFRRFHPRRSVSRIRKYPDLLSEKNEIIAGSRSISSKTRRSCPPWRLSLKIGL